MPYNPKFIDGYEIPLPTLSEKLKKQAYRGGMPIEHTRFSIIFHEIRDLAICTAHNIDGGDLNDAKREGSFKFDPFLPREIQIDTNRGYSAGQWNNPWDRGHLVRVASLKWGDLDEAEQAIKESFYFSNIAPQHENLHDKPWGEIEDWMLGYALGEKKKASVFTGPIFTEDDAKIYNNEREKGVFIPAGFWKVMVILTQQGLTAAGFMFWQRDYDSIEPLEFSPTLEQVRITTIEFLTNLRFSEEVRKADPLLFNSTTKKRSRSATVVKKSRFINNSDDLITI